MRRRSQVESALATPTLGSARCRSRPERRTHQNADVVPPRVCHRSLQRRDRRAGAEEHQVARLSAVATAFARDDRAHVQRRTSLERRHHRRQAQELEDQRRGERSIIQNELLEPALQRGRTSRCNVTAGAVPLQQALGRQRCSRSSAEAFQRGLQRVEARKAPPHVPLVLARGDLDSVLEVLLVRC